MTKVAEIERIRWAYFREGKTQREIAREFKVSRKTVTRALKDPGPWTYRQSRPRAKPVMDAVAPIIVGWLEADLVAPRKQRHTAKRIYRRLVGEYGFTGGETTVRQWVQHHRPATTRAVTIPLAHDAGAEAQVDFGEAVVRINGEEVVAQVFCARLAHSTRDVMIAYPQQDRAAWLDGHVRAFEVWGGAPASIWYDNPSQLGRFHGGRFEPCDEFVALQSAYGFRAHHCTPGEGHEKGLVEGLVGYGRRTHLVPVPEMASWEALNAYLAASTAAEERLTRAGQTETVGDRFAQERELLQPLPARPFLPCTRHMVRATQQALVMFRGRRYSAPVRHAGQRLTLGAYAWHVEVWTQSSCIARHERSDGPGEAVCDFWHYVPVLQRKPGAFANAVPVRQAQFPPAVATLLRALEEQHGTDRRRAHREFLAACALGTDVEPVRWEAACATAVARGEVSAAGVRAALLGEPAAKPVAVTLPPSLDGVAVLAGDVGRYNALLEVSA